MISMRIDPPRPAEQFWNVVLVIEIELSSTVCINSIPPPKEEYIFVNELLDICTHEEEGSYEVMPPPNDEIVNPAMETFSRVRCELTVQ